MLCPFSRTIIRMIDLPYFKKAELKRSLNAINLWHSRILAKTETKSVLLGFHVEKEQEDAVA